MKRVLMLLMLLAAGSLAVFVWYQTTGAADSPGDTPTVGADDKENAPGRMAGDPGRPGIVAAEDTGDDPAAREQLPVEVEAAPTVTLQGRCVYAGTTQPIAGCKVFVGGWPGSQGRMDEYLKEGPAVVWKHPPHQTTSGDGRFVVRFVPPPPYQYYISIDTPGLATMYGRWLSLQPGVKDLGDIAIPPGSRITGRVIDEHGVPQAGVYVTFHREGCQPMPRGVMFAEHSLDKSTDDDGYFELNTALVAGNWYPDLVGRKVVEPKVLKIPKHPVDRQLLITVKPKEDVPAITGKVFDDAGKPVAGVNIQSGRKDGGHGNTNLTHSNKDGSFRLERHRGQGEEPVVLLVGKAGHEPLVTAETYVFGTKDVILRLQRGVNVELLVVDAESGQPVTDYAVRCFPDLGKDFYSPRARVLRGCLNGRLRLDGNHKNGLLTIPGLVAAEHVLMVSPATGHHAPSAWHRVKVEIGTPRQVVRLEALPRRILEVVSTGGEPVAGTKVELFYSSANKPITFWTQPQHLNERLPFGNFFLILQRGITDATGQLELDGPPREKLTLRIQGPGHVPRVVPDVILADKGPLRVEVQVGATVRGKVVPAAVLADFRADSALLEQYRAMGPGGKHMLNAATPGFLLMRKGGGPVAVIPMDRFTHIPIAEDGSFEITHVPAGTWAMYFKYAMPRKNHQWQGQTSIELPAVADLEDGETRQIQVDLSFLVTTTIIGTAFVNGRPLAGGDLAFRGVAVGGQPAPAGQTIKTGTDGSFRLKSVAGKLRVTALVPLKGPGPAMTLPDGANLTIQAGKSEHQDLHFEHGQLRLRLLASDGKTPVAGIQLSCGTTDGKRGVFVRKSDQSGLILMDVFPTGNYVLTAWRKGLNSQLARLTLWRKDRKAWQQAQKEARFTLARIQVIPRVEPATRDLILPASSGY